MAAEAIPFELHVEQAGAEIKTYRLDSDHVTLGRSKTCDVTIYDDAISRLHAELRRQGRELTLTPLSATNSTTVNGARIRDSVVLDVEHDTIVLSEAVRIRASWAPPPPQTAAEGMRTHVLDREAVFSAELATPVSAEPTPTVHLKDGKVVERQRADDVAPAPEATPARPAAHPVPSASLQQPPGYVVHVRDGTQVRELVQRGFQLGSSTACDVRLPEVAPRKAALIVRCEDCYQLWNVCENAKLVSLNGEPVPDSAVLADGDSVNVCGLTVTFEQPA